MRGPLWTAPPRSASTRKWSGPALGHHARCSSWESGGGCVRIHGPMAHRLPPHSSVSSTGGTFVTNSLTCSKQLEQCLACSTCLIKFVRNERVFEKGEPWLKHLYRFPRTERLEKKTILHEREAWLTAQTGGRVGIHGPSVQFTLNLTRPAGPRHTRPTRRPAGPAGQRRQSRHGLLEDERGHTVTPSLCPSSPLYPIVSVALEPPDPATPHGSTLPPRTKVQWCFKESR